MSLLNLMPNIVNILDKFIPDKDLKAKLEFELVKGLQTIDMAQIEVNKEEAKHKSLFVSGWRPFIGWCCGVALCYHAICVPLLQAICEAFGLTVSFPSFDLEALYPILLGMIGLSASRSYEKRYGVARK
jgi:hypothetical protein